MIIVKFPNQHIELITLKRNFQQIYNLKRDMGQLFSQLGSGPNRAGN